jgi:hypothetical protein
VALAGYLYPVGKKGKTGSVPFFQEAAKECRGFSQLYPAQAKGAPVGLNNLELGSRMLSISEAVTTGLAAVIVMEKQDTVDVRFLSSLPALEQDLLRLRWIASQLK